MKPLEDEDLSVVGDESHPIIGRFLRAARAMDAMKADDADEVGECPAGTGDET